MAHARRSVRCPDVLAVILVLVLAGSAFAQETLVQTYQGNGTQNTRPFTVGAGWEIQWDATGDLFQAYLYDANGNLVEVAANQMGSGSGASFQPRAGSYYLQANAIGSWTIQIVQLPSGASTTIRDGGSEYRGSGVRNLRPFTTTGPWEVQWNARGDIFQLYLYAVDGDLIDVSANQGGPGNGASYQPRSGTYYFQVNAMGDWTVRIVPVD